MESKLEQSIITKGRYTYVHDVNKGPPEAIDVHHIIVRRGGAWGLMFCIYALLGITCFMILLPVLDKSVAVVLLSFIIPVILLRRFQRKQVEKAFGVQLETIYRSGRTVRRFVPIDKILKPVLNECVTPVTCYWSLSLIIRGEEQLLLVFKESHPPVTMLVPIWKALCASIDKEECADMLSNCETR